MMRIKLFKGLEEKMQLLMDNRLKNKYKKIFCKI